ncbi:MAG: sulfatase [Planctomycetaceae bacterium]
MITELQALSKPVERPARVALTPYIRTLGLLSTFGFFLAGISAVPAPVQAAGSPNIVFILADDQGWHQAGCYGSHFYVTPNIDRLAAEGMRFTSAYAACQVCSPTRASIMTGKYPARLHITNFIPGSAEKFVDSRLLVPAWQKSLPLEEVTIAEALKNKGYSTGHFGKWHLNIDKKYKPGRPGDPASQGFDDVLTTHKPGAGPKSKYEDDAHHVREITERALTFIKANRSKPFFCYVTHNSIHRPITERPELVAKYQARADSSRPDQNPVVGAMMDTLDRSVGRILDQLDALNLSDNTLVIYYSDNGCMWGSDVLKPLRGGKAQMWEGGIRVPFIVRWPGVVEPGSVCDVPVTSVDMFPTLLDAAGEKPSFPNVDGESLLPLLSRSGELTRSAIYWHYPHYHHQGGFPSGAIRRGHFKLIEWFDKSIDGIETPGALQLFDLQQDISEQHDLSEIEPDLTDDLYQELRKWRAVVGAQTMPRRVTEAR